MVIGEIMEIVSFIGIILALAFIIWGSMRSYSLILLSTIAALIVAATGGVNVFAGYANNYMGGVGRMVTALFPIFLGGQIFSKLIEASNLATSIANSIVKKFGTKQIVSALFIATFLMSVGGIDVFVIIFTMYPLACAFFKHINLSRNIIPGTVLGAAVAHQSLPGMPIANIVLAAEKFGVTPMAGFYMATVGALIVFFGNLLYLNYAAKKSMAKGEIFVLREGDEAVKEVDLNEKGLPNPWLIIVPMSVVVFLINLKLPDFRLFGIPLLAGWPAWAGLFVGSIIIFFMFYGRIKPKIMKLLNEGAKGSMSVMNTAAICGFASIVTVVPGYAVIAKFLNAFSFGSPYILAFLSVALIAGVTGSATGGLNFALEAFSARLVEMGGDPSACARVISQACITLDSMPHNSAVVLTLLACGVSHKDGYFHVFMTTVVMTTAATVAGIIMASLGIIGF
jgi:H+/gluconate symporter-like permease